MTPTPNWKMKTLPLALTLAITAMVSSTNASAEIKSIAGIDLSKYADYLEHAAEIRIGPESFAFLKMNYKGVLKEQVVDKNGIEYAPDEILKRYLAQFQEFGKVHPTLLEQIKLKPTAAFKVMVM